MRRTRGVRLRRADDGYLVERPGSRRVHGRLRLAGEAGAVARLEPARLGRALRGRDVDVMLQDDEVLVRKLEPLPPESRPYLAGIVHHYLERLTPWLAPDLLFATTTQAGSASDPRLHVTVVATARSIHERVLSALKALGPRQVRLLYDAGGVGPLAIPVVSAADVQTRRALLRRQVLAWLSLAGLVVVMAGVAQGFEWRRVSAELASVERAIEAARREVAARGLGGADGVAALVARKRTTPFTVIVLEELSEALPDETWLTELRISEKRARMIGVTSNVAELIPLLEEARGLTGATFFAPTTRLPDGAGERFHIDVTLRVPEGEPK
jgi:general secretion pathway protein L